MAKHPDAKHESSVASLREVQSESAVKLGQTLDKIASQIGGNADVRAVFGEPVTQHDVTVIPVARVFGGFGAGAGRTGDSADAANSGSTPSGGIGAGGGFYAAPVGFIEIDRNGARFRSLEGPLGQWGAPAELALRLLGDGLRALAAAVQRRR